MVLRRGGRREHERSIGEGLTVDHGLIKGLIRLTLINISNLPHLSVTSNHHNLLNMSSSSYQIYYQAIKKKACYAFKGTTLPKCADPKLS